MTNTSIHFRSLRLGGHPICAGRGSRWNAPPVHDAGVEKKGQLSDDQAHRVGTFLGLRDGALAYFLLLVQESKIAHPASKRYFAARRAALRLEGEKLNLAPGTTIVAAQKKLVAQDFISLRALRQVRDSFF